MQNTPQISSEGNNVYVVWEDEEFIVGGNFDIFFAASNDNGQNFDAPINISNTPGFSFGSPFGTLIAAIGDNVYSTWQDFIFNSNFEIFFAASNDNGQNFDAPINISKTPETSDFPQIAAVGDNVYVIWKEDTSTNNTNTEIFFAASNDNGTTFNAPINISNNIGISELARIAAVGDNVYVTWHDNTFAITGDYEILFAVSNNNGTTFNAPLNISKNAGGSFQPEIAVVNLG